MTQEKQKPLYYYLSPINWHIWLAFLILRLNSFLPLDTQIKNGKFIGRIGHKLLKKRRAITRRNINLAFPDFSKKERDQLTLEHFEAIGASFSELGLSRWGSRNTLIKNSTWEGKEYLQEAIESKRGIILLSAHFTTLEISGRILNYGFPEFNVVYRKNRNEFINEILQSSRKRYARKAIEKRDIKSMIRTLRNGGTVWYAPDQSYNRKQSEVIPFFSIPAMTNTATSTIAKLGNALILPFFPRRLASGKYVLTFKPLIKDFPSNDAVKNTKRYVEILEKQIRLCPEQYYWIHRKYKNLPKNYENYYANLEEWM
jgi:KDO2-lipid IV(A) lauroyltransferase